MSPQMGPFGHSNYMFTEMNKIIVSVADLLLCNFLCHLKYKRVIGR